MWSITNGTGSARISRRQRYDVGRIHVQDDMPAERRDAADHPVEDVHVRGAAKVPHEVEAHAAHAARMQRLQRPLLEGVVDDGDAARRLRRGGDGVEHGGIVGAVAARLHDHGAAEAQVRVQRRQRLLGGVLGRVAPARA